MAAALLRPSPFRTMAPPTRNTTVEFCTAERGGYDTFQDGWDDAFNFRDIDPATFLRKWHVYPYHMRADRKYPRPPAVRGHEVLYKTRVRIEWRHNSNATHPVITFEHFDNKKEPPLDALGYVIYCVGCAKDDDDTPRSAASAVSWSLPAAPMGYAGRPGSTDNAPPNQHSDLTFHRGDSSPTAPTIFDDGTSIFDINFEEVGLTAKNDDETHTSTTTYQHYD